MFIFEIHLNDCYTHAFRIDIWMVICNGMKRKNFSIVSDMLFLVLTIFVVQTMFCRWRPAFVLPNQTW